MNILICGGAGYVGGALTDLLKNTNHTVRVYDNLTFEDAYLKDVEFVRGDVRDYKTLQPQLDWADTVVWLAAIVGDGACTINPEVTQQINQEAVRFLSQNFSGKIIFMSTCSVYGAQDALLDEHSPTNPLSLYAQTKLAAEGFLDGKDALILRLGTLFGKGDDYSRIRLDLVVNTLAVKAHQDSVITVYGGEQYRPLLHVKDAARAIVAGIEQGITGTYNLSAANMRIIDLANEVNNVIPCQIQTVDTSFEDARNYRVSTEAAKAWFRPQYPVQYGIEDIRELLEEQRIRNLNSPKYTNHGYMQAFNHWENWSV